MLEQHNMLEQQLDLFSAAGIPAEQPLPQGLALCPAATPRTRR
jgi:hypothetical protein